MILCFHGSYKKYAILGYAAKYSWTIGLQDFLLLICLTCYSYYWGFIATLYLLNSNFFCFATKNNFLSLCCRFSIKVHFLVKSPVIYYFQTFIEIMQRCFSIMYKRKQEVSSANSLHW